ncbi:hypothetical protein CTAYLR_007060 [Chrysophaeum taylorii]|uniref:Proline racemase n=1 Tax=Chrysophaeum taylorii TaxID=2483200 RepID=A0AAD7UMJ2_9STRA|nr:hypothetical protein CTAYLR_007060 [Chrysophaeum taylorii]
MVVRRARRLLQVVDAHCGGEPARVVVGGLPVVPGSTMLEKRQYFREHLDHLRCLLCHEPRGYPCQNANFLVAPTSPEASFGVVIGEQAGVYPAMSGHNLMCVATVLVEAGMVSDSNFKLDTPAGIVAVHVEMDGGKARVVTLQNAPSFCRPSDMDIALEVPGVGLVRADVAFGGMWYCIVDVNDVGLGPLDRRRAREIARVGEAIKAAARRHHPVTHPEYAYDGPDILVFREPASRDADEIRALNTVVMSSTTDSAETWSAMLDRSPCGTGTCAVMAQLHARGELGLNERFVHESIVGTHFIGRLTEECVLGDGTKAVRPTISGSAWITQHATVVLDPTDPFPRGILPHVADIW